MKTLRRFISTSLFAVSLSLSALAAEAVAAKGAEPAHISQGAVVELKDHAVADKIMIYDFTSQYCPPCRAIAPRLAKLHAVRADIAVVKVDINRPDVKGIDWKSPVARQYALRSIPHFKVFGADGKLLAEGDAGYELVEKWLTAAGV